MSKTIVDGSIYLKYDFKNKEMPLHGGRYTSEREKHKAGLLAEQKVLAYLKHHKETFANVEGYSRNLKQNDGDDSRHYDIEYSVITDGIIGEKRFLEIFSRHLVYQPQRCRWLLKFRGWQDNFALFGLTEFEEFEL